MTDCSHTKFFDGKVGPVYYFPWCFSAEEICAAEDVMRVVRQQLSNEEMYALVQHRVVERRFDAWMDRLETERESAVR